MLHKVRQFLTIDHALPLLAIVIALSWVWSTVGVMQRNFQFQRQIDELRQEIALLELQTKTMQYKIAYYKTGEYVELAARQDLNLAGPGEKVLVVPPSSQKETRDSSIPSTPPSTLNERSNFQQWMDFLFRQHTGEG